MSRITEFQNNRITEITAQQYQMTSRKSPQKKLPFSPVYERLVSLVSVYKQSITENFSLIAYIF